MKTVDVFRLAGVALAGAAAGAAVALLVAPEDGRHFRRRVARRMQDEAGEALRKGREVLSDAGDRLEEELEACYRKAARAVAP